MTSLPDAPLKSTLVLCGRQAPTLAIVCVRWRDALRCRSTLRRLCDAQWQRLFNDNEAQPQLEQWPGVARHAFAAGDATAPDLATLFRDLALAHTFGHRAGGLPLSWRFELRHRGTSFPRYEPHGAALLYDGAPVALTAEQEEAATAYAAVRVEVRAWRVARSTDDARRFGLPAPVRAAKKCGDDAPQKYDDDALFRRNFFLSWRLLLDRTDAGRSVTEFARCDFGRIEAHLESTAAVRCESQLAAVRRERWQREARRHMSNATSSTDDSAVAMGEALVDGRLIRLVGFEMPPAELFRSPRFSSVPHPARGRFRPRCSPEDAALNLDAAAPVPLMPDVGDGAAHSWGGVVSNPTVRWAARWRNPVTGSHESAGTNGDPIFRSEEERRRAEEEEANSLGEYYDWQADINADVEAAEYDDYCAERDAEEAQTSPLSRQKGDDRVAHAATTAGRNSEQFLCLPLARSWNKKTGSCVYGGHVTKVDYDKGPCGRSRRWQQRRPAMRLSALSGLFGLFGGMRASGRSCPKAKSAWRGLCREMRDSNIAMSSQPFALDDAGEAGRTNGGVVVNYNGQFTLR